MKGHESDDKSDQDLSLNLAGHCNEPPGVTRPPSLRSWRKSEMTAQMCTGRAIMLRSEDVVAMEARGRIC
jgi:hypothetical protein